MSDEKLKLMGNTVGIEEIFYVSFTPTQPISYSPIAVEVTLCEPTKECLMNPVDCILRHTDSRKHFMDKWH